MKIWVNKNDNGFYTTLKNNFNGEEIKMFMSVYIKGLEETARVWVVDGFPSCYKAKDGTVKPKLVITEYEIIQKNEPKTEQKQGDPFQEFGDTVTVDNNFLD